MAIINAYPGVTELKPGNLLLISDTSVEGNPTKTATIDSLISLIPPLVPGGGTMSSWNLTGDNGTVSTVLEADTVNITGGTKITTAAALTDTLTIDHDATTRVDTTSTASPVLGGTFTCVDSITQDATGHPTAVNLKTVTLPTGVLRPYQVYSALLTQAGILAPIPTVLEGTIPGVFTWTRQGAGEYQITSTTTTPFTVGQTQVFVNNGSPVGNSCMVKWERITDDKIIIKTIDLTGALADDLLDLASIEIRVY